MYCRCTELVIHHAHFMKDIFLKKSIGGGGGGAGIEITEMRGFLQNIHKMIS